jgi:TIGR00159 family protein
MNLSDLYKNIISYVGFNDPMSFIRAVVDISIVSYLIYKLIFLVRETRAWQLIKGILLLFVAEYISGWLGLKTLEFILRNLFQLVGFALVVLFQPELRRALEQLGRSKFKNFFTFDEEEIEKKTNDAIEEMVNAAAELSRTKTGALIVLEGETKLGEIINTGVQLDSKITCELIINIFTPNTPLHDGAVVIRNNQVKAAACFLPLTDNPNLSKELGTRHRAALGVTEVSDCAALIVSEETGKISFALNGGLTRNLNPDTLRKALKKNLIDKNGTNKKLHRWKVKSK